MKIMSVAGARPQFVKLAPIAHACAAAGVEHVIVHTGQHYDPLLSDVFFRDLEIPAPDVHLGVGSASHGKQTGAILAAMDDVLEEHRPDWLLVYGDTNSTLAAALSAVKLHYPVAHLEAGLRSFNRRMPEEHNRVLTDHCADLLLAPTEVAMNHLRGEGLADKTVVVGDVMVDVVYRMRERTRGNPSPAAKLVDGGEYFLATIHRAENTDDPARLAAIIDSLSRAPKPVVLLAHPRLRAKAAQQGLSLTTGSLVATDSLPYPELIAAALGANAVITDSGGLQKEAFVLRVPCVTVRTETEWVETVELGWNTLVEPGEALLEALSQPAPQPTQAAPYGDGNAATTVIQTMLGRAGT